MRYSIPFLAALLATACNNPGSLPDVEEGHGASQPAAEQPAAQDAPPANQPDDDFPEIVIPDEPVTPADDGDGEPEIEAFEPAPADNEEGGAFDLRPPGMTGGPCTYETSLVTGTVIESDEDGALFESAEGDEFYVPESYVSPVPAIGETLTLERERIVEGTCTPEIYRRAGP